MKTLLSNGGLEFNSIDKYNCNSDEIMLFNSAIETINTWGNPDIMEYLNLSGLTNLGSILRSEAFASDKDLYFIFDEKQLVATTLILPSIELLYAEDLEAYAFSKKQKHRNNNRNSYMTIQKAKNLLENDEFNSCYIHYLVVNPEMQGRGYGTEVIKTLQNDIDFFDHSLTHNALMAMISRTNHPFIGLVTKHGFGECPNPTDAEFNMFYKEL